MIKQHSRLRIERLPLSALHCTECQPRYPARLMHYIDLMQKYPDDAPGLISVQPSKQYPGLYELLDGHHRYCAHIICGHSTVLCLVIEEPAQSWRPSVGGFIDAPDRMEIMNIIERKLSMIPDDQAFLNAEIKSAHESDDENAESLVLLHYQQAVLETLQRLDFLCETDAQRDLTLLTKRVERLMATTQNDIATVAVLPQSKVQALFAESRTLLRDVGQLCPACQAAIQQRILSRFRELRQQ